MAKFLEEDTVENIPKEVLDRLDALANTLGVSIEYLWGVLVRQAYVEPIYTLAVSFVGLVAFCVCAYYFNRALNLIESNNDASFAIFMLAGTGGAVSGPLFFINLGLGIKGFIQALANPDYYALKQILDIIG